MIYFIQAGENGPVKIGYSRTRAGVEKRLRSMQTGHYEKLHLRRVIPGQIEDEAELHAFFAGHRLHGEWFKPCPVVTAAFVAVGPATTIADMAFSQLRWERQGLVSVDGGLTPAGRCYLMSLEMDLLNRDGYPDCVAENYTDAWNAIAEAFEDVSAGHYTWRELVLAEGSE